MALSNKTDPEVATRNLTAWLAAKLDGARGVGVSNLQIPSASGLSYETILFDAFWREAAGPERYERLVARVQPVGPRVFPDKTLETEYRVMKALGERTAMPVPRVRWLEHEASVLGAPFAVMERVDGRDPAAATARHGAGRPQLARRTQRHHDLPGRSLGRGRARLGDGLPGQPRARSRLVALPPPPPHRGNRHAAAGGLPEPRADARALRDAVGPSGPPHRVLRGVRGAAPVDPDAPRGQHHDRRRAAAT